MVRRIFLLTLAGVFALSAAWAVAMPVNGTYDEKHHIVRAYAVVDGQWLPAGPAPDSGPGADATGLSRDALRAPASLLPANVDCTWYQGRRPASCQHPVADRTVVLTASAAARYSPVYYLPVGLPLLAWPDHTGVVLARLVSALLCALLVALAAVALARVGGRAALAGLALVATPMAVNLFGAVNPNGLEIAAGVLLFCALLALVRGDGPAPRWLLWSAGVAGVLLLTLRGLGPLLFAVDVLACGLVAAPGRIRALSARRDARWLLGGSTLLGLAFFGYWTVAAGSSTVNPEPTRAVHGSLLHPLLSLRVPFWVQQVVGQFGYGETTISRYAVLFWYALCAVVVLPALVRGGWRLRLVLAGLFAFGAVLLVGLELRYAPIIGWSQHARYIMPVGVGIVLIAAGVRPPARRWLPVALVAATVPVHLYVLAHVMTRYQVGPGASLNPLHGSWLPPGGPLVPLAVAVAGLALLVIAVGWDPPAVRVADTSGTRQRMRATTTVGRSSPVDPDGMAD